MKKDCFKRLAAWLLAALLMVSPALAEADGAEPALIAEAAAVDAVVGEADPMDLPDDDAELLDAAIEGVWEAVSAEAAFDEVQVDPEAPGEAQTDPETPGEDQPEPEVPGEDQSDPETPGEDQTEPETPGEIQAEPEAPGENVVETPGTQGGQEGGEDPDEAPEESPVEDPREESVKAPAEEPAGNPDEEGAKDPAGEAVNDPDEAVVKDPAEAAEGENAEEAREEAGEKSEESDGEGSEETDGEKAEETDGEKSKETDGEKSEETDGEKSEETDGEKSEETDGEKSEGTDGEKSEETDKEKSEESDKEKDGEADGTKTAEADAEKDGGENLSDKKAEAAATGEAEASAKAAATAEAAAPAAAPAAPEAAPAPPLLPAEIFMGKGEKRVLTPACDPAAVGAITWASSRPRVVSVSKAGKLTARRRGSAVITVATQSGLSATCLVHVNKAPAKVRILPGKKLSMGVGERYTFGAKLSKGASSALRWSSGNPAVVSVDASGVATASAPGTAKIVVKTFNGKKAVCKVRVLAAPSAVALSAGNQTLGVGMTVDMKPVVNPGAAANVALSSDNPGVVAVNGKKVTGVAPGTAVITGTTYNGLTAAATVTVVPAPTAVGLPYGTLRMGVGEKLTLQPSVNPGSFASFTYKSSKKSVVKVSAGGVIKARRRGSATVTVTAYNGLKARVKVKVYKAPSKLTLKPKSLAMEPDGIYQLKAVMPKGSAGTVTFTSSNPGVVTVEASGLVRAHQVGNATITAVTYNRKKASCKVIVGDFSGGTTGSDGSVLTLSNQGMVMLAKGARRSLTASSTGSMKGIAWTTTSKGIAAISADGATCTVSGAGIGTAIVGAKLPSGASASVIVMVVDVNDVSASNFSVVLKALLAHEDLFTSEAGGNVIWDMTSAKLRKSGIPQARVNSLIASLKAADATYRNLYLFSLGCYSIVAENGTTPSNFDQNSNKLYLKKSSEYATGTLYDFVVFHESGHAIDWNYNGGGLDSLNSDATNALLYDVRKLLADRLAAAVSASGVSDVNGDKVIDALMDYRTVFLKEEEIASTLGLTGDEMTVYNQLANSMGMEMNATLPINNGCMVWDGVEGATNYAVHGSFGHYYLTQSDQYKDAAKTYYYDLQGNPTITTEPWAEFFSANIMGDSNTLQKNWSYLPQTCKYFAETFVPKLVGYFTDKIKNA